ncbi:sulfotransferase family protein [Sphaerimonospora thailandensis]|uniref:Sulfotransferase n=1 Tax=Sphaerimonospora thailandensis TaxID=795644 RepID=A0A8J3VX43_9ACTN|nr:sulfotransferase [Sphaerimonospora thailandensis]GIH68042.1 sulfotransferase [Sphaerimonospora thailandensis]
MNASLLNASAAKLRIEDLRDPVLTDAQRTALAHAERHPADLTVDAVLARARTITGLDDFGPDDFVERLRVWLDEIRLDPNRTALAGRIMFDLCVKYAANRLRITGLLARRPEIHDQEIVAPLFITGLPRTGTTHLVNLLAADARFRSLPLWEADQPVPDRGEGPGAEGVDPRYARCDRAWQRMRAGNPYLAAWHPMNPDSIHEDIELWANDFAGYNIEWIFQMAPRWREHYLAHDQTSHYRYLKTVLKVLQWYRPGERWLLKCPQHLENLGPLMEVFPDATVVMTHRDPVGAVQSAATMRAYGSRTVYRRFDVAEILEYWTDLMERLLRAGVDDRHLVPEGGILDVYFDRFMADTMGTVEQVYRHAGMELTERARAEITAYVDAHPRDKHGSMTYDLRADFGITPERLRDRFAFYLRRHPVPIEVR